MPMLLVHEPHFELEVTKYWGSCYDMSAVESKMEKMDFKKLHCDLWPNSLLATHQENLLEILNYFSMFF